MEINYERRHNDSYMLLEGCIDKSSYEWKMIEANNISPLLEMTTFSIDGKNKISYSISRKENLEDYMEGHDITIEVIERIIINLKLALDELGKYLIDEQHIWINKESIFIEKSNESFRLGVCYYPEDFGTVQIQFRELMEFFLSAISKESRDEARQLYLAYDLCLKDDYTLKEIIECLQDRVEKEPEIYIEHVTLDNDEIESEAFDIEAEKMEDYFDIEDSKPSLIEQLIEVTKNFFPRKSKSEDSIDFAEDFVIDPDYEFEEKTVLLTESKAVGKLVYDGNSNEDDFIINKDVFRIGSSKNNDAILKAKTVSGNHAKITKEGEDYFLIDSNSLNGSFLNSTPLAYRKPYKLHPMDVIRFASESYVFM